MFWKVWLMCLLNRNLVKIKFCNNILIICINYYFYLTHIYMALKNCFKRNADL